MDSHSEQSGASEEEAALQRSSGKAIRNCKNYELIFPSKELYQSIKKTHFSSLKPGSDPPFKQDLDFESEGQYIVHLKFSEQKRESQVRRLFPLDSIKIKPTSNEYLRRPELTEEDKKEKGKKLRLTRTDRDQLGEIKLALSTESVFLDELLCDPIYRDVVIKNYEDLQRYVVMLNDSLCIEKFQKRILNGFSWEEVFNEVKTVREKTFLLECKINLKNFEKAIQIAKGTTRDKPIQIDLIDSVQREKQIEPERNLQSLLNDAQNMRDKEDLNDGQGKAQKRVKKETKPVSMLEKNPAPWSGLESEDEEEDSSTRRTKSDGHKNKESLVLKPESSGDNKKEKKEREKEKDKGKPQIQKPSNIANQKSGPLAKTY